MANVVEYILNLQNNISPEIKKADSDATQLAETLKHVGEAVGIAFGIHALVDFGKEIFHTTAAFEGFENRIKFASTSTEDFEKNIKYLNNTAKNLHLPKEELMNSFSEMQAGLVGTGIEGDKLRKLQKFYSFCNNDA